MVVAGLRFFKSFNTLLALAATTESPYHDCLNAAGDSKYAPVIKDAHPTV